MEVRVTTFLVTQEQEGFLSCSTTSQQAEEGKSSGLSSYSWYMLRRMWTPAPPDSDKDLKQHRLLVPS